MLYFRDGTPDGGREEEQRMAGRASTSDGGLGMGEWGNGGHDESLARGIPAPPVGHLLWHFVCFHSENGGEKDEKNGAVCAAGGRRHTA